MPRGRIKCLFPLQMVCERSDVFASSCAIARAFPIFSRRSSSSRRAEKKHVTVEFVIAGQDNSALDVVELEVQHCDIILLFLNEIMCQDSRNNMFQNTVTYFKCTAEGLSSVQCLSNAADGVRLAARIVDTPCNEMNTDHFLDVCENISLSGHFVGITTGTFSASYGNFDAARLTGTAFLFQEIRAVGTELGITPVIIRGEELKQRGFGGIV